MFTRFTRSRTLTGSTKFTGATKLAKFQPILGPLRCCVRVATYFKCGMVRVEFFGVPRIRAGVSFVEIGGASTLGEAYEVLANRLPTLQGECLRLQGGVTWELTDHCVANLGGDRFVRDLGQPLKPDDVLLILSADAGG
jgi:molybdopterin converting factor small subunit